MKARVKATGELDFEVTDKDAIYNKGWQDGWDEAVRSEIPKIHPKLKGSAPDYWESLLHQYAGMAMQGILASYGVEPLPDDAADDAYNYATALVEKLKGESYDKERTA